MNTRRIDLSPANQEYDHYALDQTGRQVRWEKGELDYVPMPAAWYAEREYARCLFGEDLAVGEGSINRDDAHQMTFVCALRRET